MTIQSEVNSAILRETPSAHRFWFPRLAPFYRLMEPITYGVMRAAFGLIILTHGIPKALGGAHGSMGNPMDGATGLIENALNLPFAPQLAIFAMLLETVGALAVAAGFMTRLFAPALAVEMAIICFAHAPTFAWIDRGFEYPLMLGFLALYISFRGAGAFSVDRFLPKQL